MVPRWCHYGTQLSPRRSCNSEQLLVAWLLAGCTEAHPYFVTLGFTFRLNNANQRIGFQLCFWNGEGNTRPYCAHKVDVHLSHLYALGTFKHSDFRNIIHVISTRRAVWCSGKAPHLYSRDARFDSRPTHRQTWLRSFVVFSQPFEMFNLHIETKSSFGFRPSQTRGHVPDKLCCRWRKCLYQCHEWQGNGRLRDKCPGRSHQEITHQLIEFFVQDEIRPS